MVTHRPIEAGGSTRWRHFARALPEHGWNVEVVSAGTSLTGDETATDPRVARLSRIRGRVMGRAGALARPLSRRLLGVQPEAFPPSMLWALSGRRAIRAAVAEHRPHALVATSPPPVALFAAAAVVDAIPLVADLRDPWAGSPYYDAGGRLLTEIERRALGRASAVVAVTTPMLAELRDRHPSLADRMLLLPNGFPPELLEGRPRAAPLWHGRPVTLIHPGTLYGGRTLAQLVAAMAAPDLRGRVRLQLLGSVDDETRAAIAAHPDADVETLAPVPWEEAIVRVRRADAVVVVQHSILGDAIAWPVKTFEALALGKPVLAITGGGAVEQLLGEFGHGAYCALLEDPASAATALRRLLEAPPAPVPAERLAPWDRSVVAADYATLLDRLVETQG